MSNAITELKDRLHRMATTAKNARETAKQGMTEIVGTVMGAATAAGLAVLDQEKGDVAEGDLSGISSYRIGPVPASLLVGGLGKMGAMMMMGDSMATIASDIGQAGVDVGTYLMTRKAWASHQANAKK